MCVCVHVCIYVCVCVCVRVRECVLWLILWEYVWENLWAIEREREGNCKYAFWLSVELFSLARVKGMFFLASIIRLFTLQQYQLLSNINKLMILGAHKASHSVSFFLNGQVSRWPIPAHIPRFSRTNRSKLRGSVLFWFVPEFSFSQFDYN